ncbi:UNVERIFIED_CONTAM: hypothetical protein PYX00_002708 [Menopon gallinae]|uniref:DNA replication licensing factor MCM3 n=1 Tax=Menopon gallinae TaxID=328185 RepID=A0AAW2HX40_9NEOP
MELNAAAGVEQEYLEFLDDEQESGKYYERVKHVIEEKEKRLIININDLRKKKPERAANLLKNAFQELAAFERATKEYISTIDPNYAKQQEAFFLGFEGSFGSKHVSPRTLTSQFLGNLVCVEGIVTKCSLSKLKVVRSVHYCPATKKFMERKYTDITSTEAYPSSTVYPTKDDEGNLLETEFGLSVYKDHQTLTIQEMPEKAPAGQLPRSVDIICENDLVDICKPGDRIQVVGCYRCLPAKHGSFTSGIFRTVIIANSINHLTVQSELSVTREDMMRFKKLVKKPNIFDLLSRSLAPSIHGHEYVKKAILCLLIGGNEKILENGTRLRGDINVLLIGDPSVAKSQLLRYVLQAAPRAVPTTGRGSSGVGLTAAVTSDPETGERRLEAGAMVLADRGVVCIDEFDKMSDIDRTAIHEVMEQGKVTVAKAGIHARLNARCSVLAAANPVYGKYDQYKTPVENIGLQDSLLSRFDLLFVLLDLVDTDDDKRISDHVVRIHRYRNPNEQDGDVLPMGSSVDIFSTHTVDDDDKSEDNDVFEKYDPLLHGATRSRKDQIINIKFMRKYILICKNLRPKLSEEASEIISEEYSRLRTQDFSNNAIARTQPITARTLETLIRLSTAHAKARFSRTIDAVDAKAAVDLVQYAVFRKVLDKKDRRKRTRKDIEDEIDVDFTGRNGHEQTQTGTEGSQGPDEEEGSVPATLAEYREQAKRLREAPPEEKSSELPEARLKSFKETINRIFLDRREDSLPVEVIVDVLKSCPVSFSESEIKIGFEILSEANQIMIADNVVFLI